METVTAAKTRYTFSGHDSFQCRHFWLKKGFDYVKSRKSFHDEDAVVKLGVGKNMVAAIRFWLKAFNIVDFKDNPTDFGANLLDDNGWDPFLEDDASLWLLHYQLVKANFASTYGLIFNELRRERLSFNRDSYLNFLKRKKDTHTDLVYNEKTAMLDFDVFIKMYQGHDINSKAIEDGFSGILSDINLLKTVGDGKNVQYQIENTERDNLPEEVLLYSILDNQTYGYSISINSLENDYNSPGVIFALDRSSMVEKILELERTDKNIIYTDQAGIRELQFKKKSDANQVLKRYYEK